jgi:thymidylate kinase
VHPVLQSAFQAMNDAGIRWGLLRGHDDLAASAGDVDLLVHPGDLQQLNRILSSQTFRRRVARGRGTHAFFVTYHAPTDSWLKLDVVSELSFGPGFSLRTGAEEEVLARRRCQGPTATLAPDDEFWALLLHCLLDKLDFEGPRARRLTELSGQARTDGRMPVALRSACPPEWSPERVLALVQSEDWRTLRSAAPRLLARWFQRLGAGVRLKARLVDRVKDTRLLHSVGNRGLSVALLGPDGAGKSTLAEAIARSSPLAVKRLYMGMWSVERRKPGLSAVKGVAWARRLGRLLWRAVAGWGYRSLGYLVIFDRYTFDARLPVSSPSLGQRVSNWVLAHASVTPDLVFVLDVPGQVMYARKAEHWPEHLERQRQGFRRLAQELPNAVSIDASESAQAVRQNVTGHIWRLLAAEGPDGSSGDASPLAA